MKKISLLSCLVALTACGGGDSAHKIDTTNTKNELVAIQAFNSEVIGITQSVNNQSDTVSYVHAALGIHGTSPIASTDGNTDNRIGHSTTQTDRIPDNIMGKQYMAAVEKLKTLTKFTDDTEFAGLTPTQLVESYKIIGGKTDYSVDELSDEDKSSIRTAVLAKYQDILNRFFEYDSEAADWRWEPMSRGLADLELETVDGDTIKLVLNDKGRIIAVDSITGGATKSFSRTTKNNFQYTDGEVTGTAVLSSLGAKYRLKYSDFGSFGVMKNVTTDSGVESHPVSTDFYAGGYDIKRVMPADMSGEHQFTGHAIGSVTATDGATLALDGATKLVFDDGNETLSMNFAESKWHDVEISRTAGGAANIAFSGDEGIDERFIMTDGTMGDDKLDIRYYGDNNAPTEFSGMAQHADTNATMNVVFGGAK